MMTAAYISHCGAKLQGAVEPRHTAQRETFNRYGGQSSKRSSVENDCQLIHDTDLPHTKWETDIRHWLEFLKSEHISSLTYPFGCTSIEKGQIPSSSNRIICVQFSRWIDGGLQIDRLDPTKQALLGMPRGGEILDLSRFRFFKQMAKQI